MRGGAKTDKHEIAIANLLSSPTIDQAAKKTGIATSTLQKWLADPDFKQRYRDAQRQILEHTIGVFHAGTVEAAAVLRDVMHDAEAKGSERVSAAKAWVEFANKGHEYYTMRSELDELRAIVAEMRQGQKAEGDKGGSKSQGGG